jgi:hypothetical protein
MFHHLCRVHPRYDFKKLQSQAMKEETLTPSYTLEAVLSLVIYGEFSSKNEV